jgi:hypothetical protein
MARHGNAQPEPDLYQLLGVARQATPTLVGGYEMLSDLGHWAAYDQAARVPQPGSSAPRPVADASPLLAGPVQLKPLAARSGHAGPAAPGGSGDAG